MASYTQTITADFAEAHYNLGITFEELRRVDEAVASYAQAITLKPDFAEAYYNLGIAITNIRFNKSNRRLYPILLRLLTTGNFVSPGAIVGFILNLLKHDPLINKFLLEKNFSTVLQI